MSRKTNLYVGRAGQFAVLSEFLMRGYNVAIPEVDVGDDVFVVKDDDGQYWRVQVKAANGVTRTYGCSAKFDLRRDQLVARVVPELTYVFAVRHLSRWTDFVVIGRKALNELHRVHDIGSNSQMGTNLTFNLRFYADRVLCGSQDLQDFRNSWARWPRLAH